MMKMDLKSMIKDPEFIQSLELATWTKGGALNGGGGGGGVWINRGYGSISIYYDP